MSTRQTESRTLSVVTSESVLSTKDFLRLSQLIEAECGIKMPVAKKTMLESRLQKRMRNLGYKSFREYCDHLFNDAGSSAELVQMIDVITTNKTDFFREPTHFDYLIKTAIPELSLATGAGIQRPLKLWSAGCSTGEEPYTMAMVLSEYAEHTSGFRCSIQASDISTRVLEKASHAVYEHERIEPVPMNLRRKYLLKSKDHEKKLVKVIPELRKLVSFFRLNFMDDEFEIQGAFDVIFCRNVMIYFDRPTQERLLNKFCRHLIQGGFLFIGHSETTNGLQAPLTQVAPTIYRKI